MLVGCFEAFCVLLGVSVHSTVQISHFHFIEICLIKKSRDRLLLRICAEESMHLYVSTCVFPCVFLPSVEIMSRAGVECLIEKITNDEAAVKYGTKIALSS